MTTTLQILTEVSDVQNKLTAARKEQDWVEAQHQALELAKLFQQLQVEDKTKQKLSATPESFKAWLQQVRKVIA